MISAEAYTALRTALGESVGFDVAMTGYTSLRVGGATAMHQHCGDLDVVRRAGRWRSDAVLRTSGRLAPTHHR